MYYMKTTTVRDLKSHFDKVEAQLRQGETIQITKRKKVIGVLSPPQAETRPEIPDFKKMQEEIFGKRVAKVTAAELLSEERDRY
jgi:antitoxin (DNA-binding transcriptional repressor) of toxin-antitoxin stability system